VFLKEIYVWKGGDQGVMFSGSSLGKQNILCKEEIVCIISTNSGRTKNQNKIV